MTTNAIIIDGTNLFIIHYTANTALDRNGEPIGGAIGTLKAIERIVELLKPSILIFVWDGPGGSLQKRRSFKNYKSGRRPAVGRFYEFANDDLTKKNKNYQVELLKSLMNSLPICQIVTDTCEADDAIAYIVTNKEFFKFDSCIIVTCDKDFYQLIDQERKIFVFNPITKKLIDTENLIKKYEIHPKNWLFYKSINGDKSDNIQGVKGFGFKTIQKLFPIKNPNVITPESIKFFEFEDEKLKKKHKILKENIDVIIQNWKLMDLSNPMMSISEKDRLTDLIFNFQPSLSKKNFYINLMKIGNASINANFVYKFLRLLANK